MTKEQFRKLWTKMQHAKPRALGPEQYQHVVRLAASRAEISEMQAFLFIDNLISAYEHTAIAGMTTDWEIETERRILSPQPKAIM